jgi:hypothetical protein
MTTMITAHGWKATFKTDYGQITEPLLFWLSEDGIPVGYIVSARTGRPVSAERSSNFDGYARDEDADATIVPAESGWWIVERDGGESERAYWSKVLAWRIVNDGFGVKAIGCPFPTGEATIAEVEDGRIQFVFDPAREPIADGPWPTPANEVTA